MSTSVLLKTIRNSKFRSIFSNILSDINKRSEKYLSSSNENLTIVTKREGEDTGIVEICIDRPKQSLNSLTPELVVTISKNLSDIKADKNSRVVIFKSSHPKAFSIGMDLHGGAGDLTYSYPQFLQTIEDIRKFPLPTIVALDGLALGGGFEIAISCDILVGSDTLRAGLVEGKIGLVPGGSGHVNLLNLVGVKKAKELIFTSEVLKGKECFDLGIIQQFVPQNEDKNAAYLKSLDVARKILPQGTLAVQSSKRILNMSENSDYHSALTFEQRSFAELLRTEDAKEGLKSFKEQRKPKFKGE